MKKNWIILIISAMIGVGQMIYRGLTAPEMLSYIMIFFVVGWGLAILRVVVNKAILSMKGKHILTKVGFFAALLSVGLPLQSWFRKEVIMSMDTQFIVPSIISLAAGVVFFTMVYNLFIARFISNVKEKMKLNEELCEN